ncbi:MAG: LCP family protein, partial [Lachnospiraceae bacterium]|nr:LCP family protein [Lachnospiraceae bacterium]
MDFELEGTNRTESPRSRGRKKKSKNSKTRRRVITMIIAECFALLFIFGYGFVARRWNMIQRLDDWVPEEVQNPVYAVDRPEAEKQKGHWGIYVFGVDSRGSNVSKGTNADVNIICDINHDTGEIKLVSVFRDSYLNINDNGGYNKINQAYFAGGPNAAAKALNKNLDLNITDFVTFNWKAVADGINLLGGVDMEISKAEFYYINSFITETVEATGVYSTHLKKAGMNHLDGVQAVAYGRLRLMDTDFARTERQRKVIQAAFEKAKKADLATLNQLALTIFPQVATSVDIQDIIGLLGDVNKYYIGETGGFPFARGDANMGKKGACVIPQTLESNVTELHEFLYGEENYIPSDMVKKISSRISGDTGMYQQGVSIGHVSTTGGAVPKPTRPQAAEEESAKEEEDGTEDREGSGEETAEGTIEESGDAAGDGT